MRTEEDCVSRRSFFRHSAGLLALGGLQRSRAQTVTDAEYNFTDMRLPAIDCHAHVFHDSVVAGLLEAMSDVGIESTVLLSILHPGLGSLNAGTLAVKRAAPERLYAFCCIDYRGMYRRDNTSWRPARPFHSSGERKTLKRMYSQ